jgi:hypothetical protein
MVLWYQGKSCLCHRPNVRKWSCGSNTNCIVAVDQILDGGFVAKATSLRLESMEESFRVWMDKEVTHFFTSLRLTKNSG